MRRFLFAIIVPFLLVSIAFTQKGNISTVKAPSIISSSIHQGDLVLTDNNTTVIEGRFDINGSIIVEENATLILRNAVLNFTQVEDWQFNMTFRIPANGNPRLVVENVTINSNGYHLNLRFYGNSSATINKLSTTWHVGVYFLASSSALVSNSRVGGTIGVIHFSVLTLSNSSITDLASSQDSSVAISNCTLSTMQAGENSEITATNCTINTFVSLSPWSANYSVAGHKPGFVSYWNFEQNCSVAVAPDGKALDITLEDTQVGGWGFSSRGKSNGTISNSELYALWAHESAAVSVYNSVISTNLWSYESSHWHLCNTTTTQGLRSYQDSKLWLVNSTCNTYSIYQQSKAYVSWYLDVHVIDSEGTGIPSANVTATYPNATVAESKLTNANGWARLTISEKMMNATGSYPIGNYTITAKYETHEGQQLVNMTGNKQITILLPFIIPEFPSMIILPLFMSATLLTVIVHRRKRSV